METKVLIQPTPNPWALKFIVNKEVIQKGKITFKTLEEASEIPLADTLLKRDDIEQIHFYENTISVTYKPQTDLIAAEMETRETIIEKMESHDPRISLGPDEEERRSKLSPELRQIEEILDRTIRPGLQGDGGDVEVIDYQDDELSIRYQGACGSCPSSTMGTLMAIEGILKDEFDPDITVIPL